MKKCMLVCLATLIGFAVSGARPERSAHAYLVAITNVPAGSAALPPSPPGRPVATLRRRANDNRTDTVFVVTDSPLAPGDRVASVFTDEPSSSPKTPSAVSYCRLPISDELLADYLATGHTTVAADIPDLLRGEPVGIVAAKRHRFWSLAGQHLAQDFARPTFPVNAKADLALLHPLDSLMVGCEPVPHGLAGEEGIRSARLYNTARRVLDQAKRPFQIVGDDELATAKIQNGQLVQGNHRWRTVVLPGVNTLPTAVARKLTAFRLAGGTVIALGDLPVNSTRFFPDREIFELATTWTFLAEDHAGDLVDLLAR